MEQGAQQSLRPHKAQDNKATRVFKADNNKVCPRRNSARA